MPDFEDREKGYERKYEQEQELAFKVKARRNHLLGLWAAEKLSLSGDAAKSYADEIADPSRNLHGDKDVIRKIEADFKAKSVAIDAARIGLELEYCATEARKRLSTGQGEP